jgi:hypothetical protein
MVRRDTMVISGDEGENMGCEKYISYKKAHVI